MKKSIFYLLSFVILFYSCSTQLVVQNPAIEIYVNGSKKGQGSVTIPRMGLPQTRTITAKYNGQEVGQQKIKRKYNLLSFALTLYTYGIGVLFTWHYPSIIFIPTKNIENSDTGYEKQHKSIWELPPGDWKK